MSNIVKLILTAFVGLFLLNPLSQSYASTNGSNITSHSRAVKSRKMPMKADPNAARFRKLTDDEMSSMVGGCCGGVFRFLWDVGRYGLGPFGAFAPFIDPPFFGDPVNTASGNLYRECNPDITDSHTKGPVVSFRRIYNSRDSRDGAFGQGWTFNWNLYLSFPPQVPGNRQVVLQWYDGSQHTFTQSMDNAGIPIPGNLVSPAGSTAKLSQDTNGLFTLYWNKTKYFFNNSGAFIACSDNNNNTTTLSYNTNGLLTGITDPCNQTITITWNDAGTRIAKITDSAGRSILYGYSDTGILASVNWWNGDWVKYVYGTFHATTYPKLCAAKTVFGTTSFYYDSNRVATITDENNQSYSFWWVDGNTTYIHPIGDSASGGNIGDRTIIQTYSGDGFDTGTTTPDGRSVTKSYDALGNLILFTDTSGNSTNYIYDSNNRIVQIIDPQNNLTKLSYTSDGDISSITDPYGNITQYKYDHYRNLISITDPLNRAVGYTYDKYGNMISESSPSGKFLSFAYDSYGQCISMTDQNGLTGTITYDNLGHIVSIKTPDGNETKYTWNNEDHLVVVTYPDGKTVQYGYDLTGLRTVTDPNSRITRFTYTPTGNLSAIQDANGAICQYLYSNSDNPSGAIDGNGNKWAIQYDSYDRFIAVTQQFNSANFPSSPSLASSFKYSTDGKMASSTDANGNTFKYNVDSLGEIKSIIHSDGAGSAYDYDKLGRCVAVGDYVAPVITTLLPVDNAITNNSVWNIVNTEGTLGGYYYQTIPSQCFSDDMAPSIQFSFTGDSFDFYYTRTAARGCYGNVLLDGKNIGQINFWAGSTLCSDVHKLIFHRDGLSNTAHTISIVYSGKNIIFDGTNYVPIPPSMNVEGLVSSATSSPANTTTYQYDSSDQLIKTTLPDGRYVSYTYTQDGQRKTFRDYAGGITTYQYDSDGFLIAIVNPFNETTKFQYDAYGRLIKKILANSNYTECEYDPVNGWVLKVTNKNSNGIIQSSYAYTYDCCGNPSTLLYSDGTKISYNYDNLNRLVEEIRTSASGSTIYDHQWLYDNVGNRTLVTSNNVGVQCVFNSDNELYSIGTSLFGYDNNGNTTSITANGVSNTYTYDVLNHLTNTPNGEVYTYDRLGRRASKTVNGVTTYFLYDGNTLWGETDASGNVLVEYTPGISQHRNGVSSFYTIDENGNVRQLTDGSGNVTDTYDYDAWGVQISSTGTTINPYKYCGAYGYYTDNSDQILLTHRYYMPSIGRFITRDPIKYLGGYNQYRYCSDNPNSYLDPLGYADWTGEEFFGGGGGVGGGPNASELGPAGGLGGGGEPAGGIGGEPLGGGGAGEPVGGGGELVPVGGGGTAVEGGASGRLPGPTVDPNTGSKVGRFIADDQGNVMIEPEGGSTGQYGSNPEDTHTFYPNGSNYQRYNPYGHPPRNIPHGHGHLPGSGLGRTGQGFSIDPEGNTVPPNSNDAHWPLQGTPNNPSNRVFGPWPKLSNTPVIFPKRPNGKK